MTTKFPNLLRWLLISTITGFLAGALAAFFLVTLNFVTVTREAYPMLIWFLPVGGLLVGLLYKLYGQSVDAGNNLILEEIHSPRETIPLRMIPLILLGTWLTHLFGGSAGREGTAVQMGASVADQFTKKWNLTSDDRTLLLMAGMSAGFGAVFGVPFAGAIFGIEVLSIGHIRFRSVLPCLVASFAGHFTVLALGVHHTHYASPILPTISLIVVGSVLVAGLLFGFLALLFSSLIHAMTDFGKKYVPSIPLRAFLGGLVVVLGYQWVGTDRFAGLGIQEIEQSLTYLINRTDFFWKAVFTAITLGSGMKGGEVTPLLFVGATFGNALSTILPVHFSLLAALGFVGVFAGAANTPLACTLMAMEIFGPGIGLLALLSCYASYLTSGHHGIYKSQRLSRPKLIATTFNRVILRRPATGTPSQSKAKAQEETV